MKASIVKLMRNGSACWCKDLGIYGSELASSEG